MEDYRALVHVLTEQIEYERSTKRTYFSYGFTLSGGLYFTSFRFGHVRSNPITNVKLTLVSGGYTEHGPHYDGSDDWPEMMVKFMAKLRECDTVVPHNMLVDASKIYSMCMVLSTKNRRYMELILDSHEPTETHISCWIRTPDNRYKEYFLNVYGEFIVDMMLDVMERYKVSLDVFDID